MLVWWSHKPVQTACICVPCCGSGTLCVYPPSLYSKQAVNHLWAILSCSFLFNHTLIARFFNALERDNHTLHSAQTSRPFLVEFSISSLAVFIGTYCTRYEGYAVCFPYVFIKSRRSLYESMLYACIKCYKGIRQGCCYTLLVMRWGK